jgi:phosphoribosylamine--glycine ligase
MKVLIIGSGGREHALAWKIFHSKFVNKIYCAPGNAGIGEIAQLVPIKPTDIEALAKFAENEKIDLTVVGPEAPLALGIVDLFESRGLRIFGPRKLPAEIESSKVFAKGFMKKYNIPTAEYEVFSKDEIRQAKRYVKNLTPPIVIKADGLAGGKGVTICHTADEAIRTIDLYFVENIFGNAGDKIVIEKYLSGEEASIFAITDGENFLTLAPAQDHKRVFDGDKGKNTGGMGSYAPTPLVDDKLLNEIEKTIIKPTIDGLRNEGRKYKGCLYCGLMITEVGPKVLEFNCRFGDPEAQVVLPILNYDLIELLIASIEGNIDRINLPSPDATSVCVVMSSAGYPDKYETGREIHGLDEFKSSDDIIIFHAGTKRVNGKILTAGGRVLGVTAIGERNDFEGTIRKVYTAVEKIKFEGAHYRRDIGRRVFKYLG